MRFPAGWNDVYAVVRRIPRGRVATYGQVALAAGRPRGARLAGHALAALRGTEHDVPWQRVLGARGRGFAGVSILDPMGAGVQRARLEREGVRFDARGRVALATYGWRAAAAAVGPPVKIIRRKAPASPARSPRRTAGSSGPRRSGPSGRR